MDTNEIAIEDFTRVDLRIGTIRTAAPHPNADRLLVLTVDIGEAEPRQLVAGIRTAYDVRTLPGQQVVVVANLKPATLRGVQSQGMLLAASDDEGLSVVAPGRRFAPGTKVK
jgi:methionine--tRNA ligase beta chain